MAHYYPPRAFHFKVEVLGLPPNDNDVRFSEVGGLSMEMGGEELPEGGENRFVQKYPLRAKYPELVLKRGLTIKFEEYAPLGGGKWRGHGWLPWRFTRISLGQAGESPHKDLPLREANMIQAALGFVYPDLGGTT